MARILSAGLRRTLDVGRVLWRHRPATLQDPKKASDRRARDLVEELERLGPTFVKLGQLLSTRPDVMPPAYIRALSALQDHVPGFDVRELRAIVERELGTTIDSAFAHFDDEPLAAASLAQVHRARLRDGTEVVVKVQRPGISARVEEDLRMLERVAVLLDDHTTAGRTYEPSLMVEEFRTSLLRELDYGIEARNLDQLRSSLRDFPDIVVPRFYPGLSGPRVLTMDFVDGRKVTELSLDERTGLDGNHLAETLLRAYLKQVLIDGIFHADPHPGNVLLTRDHKIALIDLGMVAYLSPMWRDGLFRLLLALAEGRAEDVVDVCMELAQTTDDFDEAGFRAAVSHLVARHWNASVAEANMGRLVIDITVSATSTGLRVPSELTMLGKMMLNLDDVARALAPDYAPTRAVAVHALELMRERLRRVSPALVLERALEVNELGERMPVRMNLLLDALAHDRFKVRVDAIDEKVLVHGAQKLANRLTLGVIDAALLIGSAMMMRVETAPKLFGFPALAVVFFCAAVLGGIAIFVDVLTKDESPRRARRRARRLRRLGRRHA